MLARLSTLLAPAVFAFLTVVPPARADVLHLVDVQHDGEGAADGLSGVTSIAVSADGAYVYATGQGEDAVAVLARDAATGILRPVEVQRDGVGGTEGIDHPSALALSPDGAHLYVTSTETNAVAVFGRDKRTGRLTFVEAQRDGVGGVDGLLFASAVTVSPDGENVYAAGQRADAIAVFRRTAHSGRLTYQATVRDGVDGVEGLAGAIALTFSPDGKHLYAAGTNDNAVAVFRRGHDGALTFVEANEDDAENLRYGILGTAGLAVSPDGAHVYATGFADGTLAVFARDPTSGRLDFVGVYAQGVDGVDGLVGAYGVAVSPDGTRVYTTGTRNGTVSVFDRDPRTGELSFVEVHPNLPGASSYLAFARGVTVSADGRDVCVAGASSNALNVFRVGD